jgi:hypothetical protein
MKTTLATLVFNKKRSMAWPLLPPPMMPIVWARVSSAAMFISKSDLKSMIRQFVQV